MFWVILFIYFVCFVIREGVKQTNAAVLECLADLVRHYIQSVSANILETCEISGRVQPGIQDIMSVLSDAVSTA